MSLIKTGLSLWFSWHTQHQMVRHRRRLQCVGSGFVGSKSGRSFQLLQSEVLSEDSSDACRPAGTLIVLWGFLRSKVIRKFVLSERRV